MHKNALRGAFLWHLQHMSYLFILSWDLRLEWHVYLLCCLLSSDEDSTVEKSTHRYFSAFIRSLHAHLSPASSFAFSHPMLWFFSCLMMNNSLLHKINTSRYKYKRAEDSDFYAQCKILNYYTYKLIRLRS